MLKHTRNALFVLITLAIILVLGPAQITFAAITFEVNNTGDGPDLLLNDICEVTDGVGDCTLRAAVMEANNIAGLDGITFNLPGPYLITLAGDFPAISSPIQIDGTTQTGYAVESPVVEITGTGLDLTADGNTILALVIRDISGAAIKLSGSGGGSIISSNFIGVEADGSTPAGNTIGIHIVDSPGNLIGGSADGEQNVISANGKGIHIEGAASDGNIITRNIIGMNAAIDAGLGNAGEGILIDGAVNTVIGSSNANAMNIISDNGATGITVTNSATGTQIVGNRIGTKADGTGDFGNTGDGVLLDSSETRVGGTTSGAANAIRFNTGNGVTVSPDELTNTIIGNAISDNDGLGIDLNNDGITSNDVGDGDTGSNYLLNYPIISSATVIGSSLNIKGGYNSEAGTAFRLEFFANSSCEDSNGEGATKIYSVNITTTGSGNKTLDYTFTSSASVGDYVTATATWLQGGSTPADTSEFSPCWLVSAGTPTATNTVAPTATTGGGSGATATSGINSPTPSLTPTSTITGTPPTATDPPTITPNIPEQTLTALATENAPSATSTFSPFISSRTPTATRTSSVIQTTGTPSTSTPTATPTSANFLTIGQMTATAQAENFLSNINIGGFNASPIILGCIGLAVLLLLLGGGVELVRWLNSRREMDEPKEFN